MFWRKKIRVEIINFEAENYKTFIFEKNSEKGKIKKYKEVEKKWEEIDLTDGYSINLDENKSRCCGCLPILFK